MAFRRRSSTAAPRGGDAAPELSREGSVECSTRATLPWRARLAAPGPPPLLREELRLRLLARLRGGEASAATTRRRYSRLRLRSGLRLCSALWR